MIMRKSRELSPVQHKVLALLRDSGKPLSAYELLHRLKNDGVSAPPTVYRALDKLVREGLAHRIETLSAFMACGCQSRHDSCAFLICEACGHVQEQDIPQVASALGALVEATGFEARRSAIEVSGLCAACAEARRHAA